MMSIIDNKGRVKIPDTILDNTEMRDQEIEFEVDKKNCRLLIKKSK